LFLAALLCKAPALSLPLVLVILDFYPLRRLGRGRGHGQQPALPAWRSWVEKLPYVLLSLLFAWIAVWAREPGTRHLGPGRAQIVEIEQGSLSERVAQVCFMPWFYLSKALLPVGLSNFYPLP